MDRIIKAALAIALFASPLAAADPADFLSPQNSTHAVALTGGDTPNTYSVSVASAVAPGVATLLRPAVTNRSRRKVCFENRGSVTVAIGSSTVVASDLYIVGESTATTNYYCTNNSGAYYGAALANAAAQTVVVIEEVQSVP